jgi:hypothetical protein
LVSGATVFSAAADAQGTRCYQLKWLVHSQKEAKTQKNTQTKQELSRLNEVQAASATTAVLSCMKLQRAWVLTSSVPSSIAIWYSVLFPLLLPQNTQILLKQKPPTLLVVVVLAAAAQPCNFFMSNCAAAASIASNSI